MDSLPFGFEKPADSPGFLLWQTSTIWQRQIKKALDAYEVSHAQFVIMALTLWFGANNYNANQILISKWSKLDKMTVSKSLKKLVLLGLVTREEDSKDTRAKCVLLTDKGKKLLDTLVPIVEDIDRKFFERVSVYEQKSLTHTLGKLSAD